MKNKYNFDFDLKHKRLKKFSISLGIDYFICCSSFLKKDKGLKFLNDTLDPDKQSRRNPFSYMWEWDKKITISKYLLH